MTITEQEWNRYIRTLRKLSDTVADKVKTYVDKHGVDNTKELIDYSYALVTEYGEGAAALSAQMYDVIADLEGRYLAPAEMAPTASYGEVAKAVNGTLKTSSNAGEISGAVSRWVKMAGSDTTIKNTIRDGGEFAWIPHGDTCPFCLTLASRGWQKASKKALKNGHAEHIHSNCDCQYAVRFNSKSTVSGYNPDVYKKMYYGAEGSTPNERINAMRREQYSLNPEKYRLQKRNAYEERNRKLDYGELTKFVRGSQDIKARPVTRFSENNLYVADDVKLSKSEVRWINNRATEAKGILNITDKCNIPIVVVNDDNALATYNPHTNVMYVSSRMSNTKSVLELQKGFAAADNVNSTMVHEMIHWRDANDYRKTIGAIDSSDTRSKYSVYQREKAISGLDQAGIDVTDSKQIEGISAYAFEKWLDNDFEEVYTEHRTKVALKKGGRR